MNPRENSGIDLRSGDFGPLLFSHRGSSQGGLVENTLPAFRRALELGADVLELDVHCSRDGVVFVSHDATGERLAGVPAAIADTTAAELERWSLRSDRDALARRESARLTRLDTLLRELPDARLNIDVKQSEPDMCEALLRTIDAHAAASRVLLTSFSSSTLARLEQLRYAGPLGMGRLDALRAAFLPASLNKLMQLRKARIQIPTSYAGQDLTRPKLIDKLHAQGLLVDYWVVNDAEPMRGLLDRGADGIVTDDIALAKTVFMTHARTAGYRARHAARR